MSSSRRLDRPVDELLARFTGPGPEFGPLPLWWWSGAEITSERLRWQMEQLVSQGVHQAVVMCLAPTGPLFGSLADDPPFLSPQWLALLKQACADAEDLGFRLWMYDQIGFSGANLQGKVIAQNPDFAGHALYRTTVSGWGEDVVLRPPGGHTALSAYAVRTDGRRVGVPVADGAARWSGGAAEVTLVHSGVSGFDYFGEEACAALLEQVHGVLEREVGDWFGRSIGGFFQDELPPLPTWGPDFARTFTEAYGYDLLPELWALWEGTDGHAARVRRDFQDHRARLARRGFFDQHDAWYAGNGLVCGFDQASPAREGDPVGGVQIYGDYLDTHARYGAPGSDHWGDAKVHSSLANAHGHGRTWIEAFHSSGWGGTLEETYDWLAPFLRRGANLYDPHAVYYSTAGGWWEWAPPSTCWRQPYWPSYHVFAKAVARLCSVLTVGSHVCDTIVLSPTTNSQAHLTLDGPHEPATRSAAIYHELNGVNTWFAEERGALERAGIDHAVLDEKTIAAGDPAGDTLRIGRETYRTVVLPDPDALAASVARRLVEFASAGGRVVCVGTPPELFLGDEGESTAVRELFATAVAEGRILVVATADDVPDVVASGPVRVHADAPYLLRRHGDAHVLTLVAHDDKTGTAAPMLRLDLEDWASRGFPWQDYWKQLHTTGYDFVPPTGRCARVRLEGLADPRAQQWDPGTGERTDLPVTPGPEGSWWLDVPFADGTIALVVLADELPAPTREPLGPAIGTVPLDGPWHALAESTLDNRWGDLGAADRQGVLPIEVWRLEHTARSPERGDGWAPVTAGFGAFAEVRGPESDWEPALWSLSRGIRNDPIHEEPLGPKGYVPEEFLDWRLVRAGQSVGVRTHLTLPDRPGLCLVVSSGAARTVFVDGTELPAEGEGYQSASPLSDRLRGRTVAVEIELRPDADGPVRASFAVVSDLDAYRRPEWLLPGGDVVVGQSAELTWRGRLASVPEDTTVQVASDGPCSLLVNGVEVGRQGDFNPYPGHREIRIHPYGLGGHLRGGENVISLRVTNMAAEPTLAALDSSPRGRGGLGLMSGPGWEASRDGAAMPLRLHRGRLRDPRTLCAQARPHPLPGAGWLEPAAGRRGVVEPVVPDALPGGPRTEWLRFAAPLGTTALRIPTSLHMVALVRGREHPVSGGRVVFEKPLAAGTPVLLRVDAVDGRRGGALLDAAVEVEVAETETTLGSWEELGLRALGGQVRYRTRVDHAPERTEDGDGAVRTVLDLGEVRGTAEVLVNGTLVAELVWGPWTSEITGALRPGENEIEVVVRGTLAGYLDDASPTMAVVAGQVRSGLFGPVRLIHHRAK